MTKRQAEFVFTPNETACDFVALTARMDSSAPEIVSLHCLVQKAYSELLASVLDMLRQ